MILNDMGRKESHTHTHTYIYIYIYIYVYKFIFSCTWIFLAVEEERFVKDCSEPKVQGI